MKTHVTGVLALLLVASVGLSVPARAQSSPSEGIKVHGRWTIDVRNPDGMLASRHEFDNALVVSGSGGSGALVALLGRVWSRVHQWQIGLAGPAGQQDGPCGPPPSGSCRILERLDGGAAGIGDLVVTVPIGLPHLVFSGSIRATAAVPIVFVQTAMFVCIDAACTVTGGPRSFTSHELAAPISVVPNQLIEVTVVISFS
jgi:hypothetical protein